MNNDRRKVLNALIGELQELQASIDNVREQVEAARDEEQDYFDNMPESLQGGEKGDRAQTAIDALQEAVDTLEQIDLGDVTGPIETACE